MNALVPVAIFGWPLVVLFLFTLLPARRAAMIGVLAAWLFLPMAGYKLGGLPDITKMSITCVTVFVGTLLFDPSRIARFRASFTDLLMVAWVLVPIPSSVLAGYGAYEGVSGALDYAISWALPYAIGRLYFTDPEALRELAIGLFVAGIIYTPLVLFEARMSPILHTWVYGFHQHQFAQARRDGGWRPTVFMQHGLAVAMFMGSAAVCGVWLWVGGKLRTIRSVPTWPLACGLFLVAAACRSSYALILVLAGTAALLLTRGLRTRMILLAMLAVPPCYVTLRTVGGWDGSSLLDFAESLGLSRAWSLGVRIQSENVCWDYIKSHWFLGDSRMDRLMLSRDGNRFVPDGLWLIALTRHGLVGVFVMYAVILLPPLRFVLGFRPSVLLEPRYAGATVLALTLVLYALDNLLNAMVNPVYLMAAGGLVGLVAGQRAAQVPVRSGPNPPHEALSAAGNWHQR
jgi:hypothetical protein